MWKDIMDAVISVLVSLAEDKEQSLIRTKPFEVFGKNYVIRCINGITWILAEAYENGFDNNILTVYEVDPGEDYLRIEKVIEAYLGVL